MNDIAKLQKCLLIRAGIEIWLDEEKWNKLEILLSADKNKLPKFVNLEGRFVNVADIVGIFKPSDLEEKTRRLNGQWRCKYGEYHDRGDICNCLEKKRIANY